MELLGQWLPGVGPGLASPIKSMAHKRIIGRVLARPSGTVRPPLPVRLLGRYKLLRVISAAFLGFGIRPEHVRPPRCGAQVA